MRSLTRLAVLMTCLFLVGCYVGGGGVLLSNADAGDAGDAEVESGLTDAGTTYDGGPPGY